MPKGGVVPGALNDAATFEGVADGEGFGIGAGEPAQLGGFDPGPGGPEDRDQQALHVAGRNVDDKVMDLKVGDSLKIFTDDTDVPVIYELGGWFDDAPGEGDIGTEVALAYACLVFDVFSPGVYGRGGHICKTIKFTSLGTSRLRGDVVFGRGEGSLDATIVMFLH